MVPTGIIPCLPWDLVFLSRCHDEDLLFLNVRGSEHKILFTDGWRYVTAGKPAETLTGFLMKKQPINDGFQSQFLEYP